MRANCVGPPNPERYAIAVEAADVMTVLSALAVAPAVVVGTSRGGLVAMTLAAAKPQPLAGVVLNGPLVEIEGMMRINAAKRGRSQRHGPADVV